MNAAPRRTPAPVRPDPFAPPPPAALAVLLRAYLLACERKQGRWQFAVSLDGLGRASLDENDLRWLIDTGYVEHGLEETGPLDPERTFRCPGNLCFTARSCFTLTESGSTFARQTGRRPAEAAAGRRPSWDGQCSLCLGGEEVKHFRQPARVQKQVLDAFEEEGWPLWIFNPLGPEGHRTGEERLHDAANRLNGLQAGLLHLRFRVENGGERVSWQVLPAERSRGRAAPKRHPSGT